MIMRNNNDNRNNEKKILNHKDYAYNMIIPLTVMKVTAIGKRIIMTIMIMIKIMTMIVMRIAINKTKIIMIKHDDKIQ